MSGLCLTDINVWLNRFKRDMTLAPDFRRRAYFFFRINGRPSQTNTSIFFMIQVGCAAGRISVGAAVLIGVLVKGMFGPSSEVPPRRFFDRSLLVRNLPASGAGSWIGHPCAPYSALAKHSRRRAQQRLWRRRAHA